MKNILVVDDDRNMNDLVSRVLKGKLKCRVTSVYNGIDAFVHIHKEVYDLIILDISMPLIHGIEILEILKSDQKFKHIPVAMMTANREKEIISKLLSLGIIDFIAKPISLDIIYSKLREILEKLEKLEKPEETESSVVFDENKFLVAEVRKDLLEIFNSSNDFSREVFVTDSGLEALKYFIKERPGFVYLGKNLPIVNEKLLIKSFRSLGEGKEIKIFVARESTKLTVEEQKNIDSVIELKENASEQAKEIKNIIKN